MLPSDSTPENGPGSLHAILRFDPVLEEEGFRRLADGDSIGCRAAFGRLVDRLDFSGTRPREGVLLLLELLLAVNRKLHRPPAHAARLRETRALLVTRFADLDDPEEARVEFMPSLDRMLGTLNPGRRAGGELAARALGFIEDHYQRKLSLSSIASRLNISPNYLSRVFRRETGRTVTEFIHRTRLEHARILLASGEPSISEVAYLVGYQNYRDFYRNFVKYEGVPPRQYRRRIEHRIARSLPKAGDIP